MAPTHYSMRIMLLFACLFLFSLTACQRRDSIVTSPVVADGQEQPFNVTSVGMRRNLAPNFSGSNLMFPAIWANIFSFPGDNLSSLFDGDIHTSRTTRDPVYQYGAQWMHSISMSLHQEVPIKRIYIITPQSEQQFILRFQRDLPIPPDALPPRPGEDSRWVQYPLATTTFGPIIDLTLPEPILAKHLCFSIGRGNGVPISISEIEVYTPPASGGIWISSPAMGSQFINGELINFSCQTSQDVNSYYWFWGENNAAPHKLGYTREVATSSIPVGTHTVTVLAWLTNGVPVSDSVSINVLGDVVSEIRIKNLDAVTGEDPFADHMSVSCRAAKTRFQAIGFRPDGSEVGPVPVDWEIQGGNVIASEQLRMGILNHLGQPNTAIGNIENSPTPVPGGSIFPVLNSTEVTFHSFLPGNISLVVKKGTAKSDSVAIRIKQPTLKVRVYCVDDVDVDDIFDEWKTTVERVWNKENIIHVESVASQPSVPNVMYPNAPLVDPMQGAEPKLLGKSGFVPSYLNPLVYDVLLGANNGYYIPPRQSATLFAHGTTDSANVFVTYRLFSRYADATVSPPKEEWFYPCWFSVSSKRFAVGPSNSGVAIVEQPAPSPAEYTRYLAAGVGMALGLSDSVNSLNNLMDFTSLGGETITPQQYVVVLNYYGDNPEGSRLLLEQ